MRRISLILLLSLVGFAAHAQDCPRGMLQISGPASYVATPSVQALNLTHGFTIECWVKPDAATQGGGIVDKGKGTSFYGIFVDTGSRFFGSVRKNVLIRTPSDVVDSFPNWHHIAYTFKPGDSIRLYIDSLEVASTSAINISAIDSRSDSLRIGLSALGVSFFGSIDELRIWNTPRTFAQILNNSDSTIVPDSTLALYYSFDDGIGVRRVHDFSGNSRDGYLQGGNVTIVQSTSPVRNASPGWHLAAKEQSIIIPTHRCDGPMDTFIHIYNVGPRPESIRAYAFSNATAFSITSSFPIPLPADPTVVASIRLHFEPGLDSVFEDTLSIIDSGECGGALRIYVRAVYDSVGLTFTPSRLNFDSVLNCDLPGVPRIVRVTNVSLTDSVRLVSLSFPAGLISLTQLPITLGPSRSTDISLQLLPGVRGPVSMQAGVTLDKCSRTAYLSVKAIRQQPEWSAPTYVNFGTVASDLAGITRDTTIVVRNTGNVTTTIQSVTSSDTMLTVLDQRNGLLRSPGDTVQLHVRIHPQTCGHSSAWLHIKGTLCATDTVVLVSINVTEPKPLVVASFDVGRICPTDSAIRIVKVANPNDQAVRLDTTSFSKNYVFFTPPLYPNLIPPHDSISLEFLFQPATDGDFVDTAFLHMSPCGIATAVLRGSRGYSGVTFGQSPLSFGRGCDTTPLTKSVTLTNNSARAITIADTQMVGSKRFVLRQTSLPFTLNPGETKQFSVAYSPRLGARDTGSLTLIASEGCGAIILPLRGSRERANATFSKVVLDFDTVCPGNSNIRTVRIQNLGIDSIDVIDALVSGHGFTLESAPKVIGDTATIQIRYNGYINGADTGTLVLDLDQCGTKLLLPLRGLTGPTPAIALSDTVLEFSSVKVGVSSVKCITIANPSCIPLHVTLDSAALAPYTPERSTFDIAAGQSMKVCFTFAPTVYGQFTKSLHITSDSAPMRSIALNGIGLAPDVRLAEHIIDFGYVLRGTSKILSLHLSNVGNDVASISTSKYRVEYSDNAPTTIAASSSGVDSITFSPTLTTGLVLDTLVVNWSGHLDTVYLRGQGTEAGMIASATALNFGDVHVTDSLTLPIYITATQDSPTVRSVTLLAKSSPAFTDSAVVPKPITSDHDTLTIGVKYHPLLEQRDTGYLLISDGAKFDTVLLAGRGVEAHVQVNPLQETVDTQIIDVPLVLPAPINIKNIGTYRLFVNSLVIGPDFQAEAPDPSIALLPGETKSYNITFTPHRARHVVDSLYIYTSSPDKVQPIAFEGVGIYPTDIAPSFGYTIRATQTSPGERDTIPVSISGVRLAKIDADSLKLEISYDPSMVLMHGIVSDSAHRMMKTSDSTIECVIKTSAFPQGTVFSLDAEALLGPNSTSYIHIKRDEPRADVAEAIDDGLYQVIDCGGTLHGVVFGGGYKVQSISPNPASDQLTLSYQIGITGPIAIDLIDELGRTAKHIEAAQEREGSHTRSIDVSSLPPGRYVYRIESLDFKASGSVLLVR
jgi:hypothetical protein